MAAFSYFVPGVTRLIKQLADLPADVAELKAQLTDIRGQPKGVECNVTTGPGDVQGLMFSVGPPAESGGEDATVVYEPEVQQWQEVRKRDGSGPAYWFGFDKRKRPRPIDVVRPHLLAGHPVKLLDGAEWIVPILKPGFESFEKDEDRRWRQFWSSFARPLSSVPQTFSVDPMGELTMPVDPRYRDICAESEKWFELTVFGSDEPYSSAAIWRYAVKVLSLNYRIGQFETSDRGITLLDTDTSFDVAGVSCGRVEIHAEIAERKKKEMPTNPTTDTVA